ncbi:putative zinc phosphodiesterase [Phytophthora cinnamomi]|uniref:putative zinc phosphodiesterase n=1 Tax=Phytophthora cinnamomi TaxID=4785 RepID=UPI00355A2F98|nr:putative zinc phosphodiesterase [Phytophthora cinnamomi]
MAASRISVTAEVVGTGSDGTEPSLLFSVQRHGLYSDDVKVMKRYLFNCGEGTQRLAGENGIKLSSLDAMYFTRFDIKSVSGVPGVIFALGSCGAATLRLHGPVGLRRFLAAIRSFVRRKYPQIQCVEITVVLRDLGAAYFARRYYTAKVPEKIPYVDVVLNRYRGRYDDLKAQLFTKYGDIAEIDSSSSPGDAEAVRDSHSNSDSSSVSDSDGNDAPQFDYTQKPLDRRWLEKFYAEHQPEKLIHIDRVLRQFSGREENLKEMLLKKYGEDAASTASAVRHPAVADESVPHKKRKLLHDGDRCDDEIPKIQANGDRLDQTHSSSSNEMFGSSSPLCYVIQFQYTPYPVVWIIDCPTPDHLLALERKLAGDCVAHSPTLVVHLSPPNVQAQTRYKRWMASISMLSTQPDHLVFNVRVLYEYWYFHTHRKDGNAPRPLVVVAPQSVLSYVENWLPQILGKSPDHELIRLATCADFNDPHHPLRHQLLSEISYAVTSILSVRVFHCYDSYGLVLTLQGGKKLVYSGDTKPCNELVLAGMGAELLVHEATFDDSMEEDAMKKKHSTVGQALDIARRMRARQVVLTHFSQRYPSLPPPVSDSGSTPSLLCAFDGFVHPMPF